MRVMGSGATVVAMEILLSVWAEPEVVGGAAVGVALGGATRGTWRRGTWPRGHTNGNTSDVVWGVAWGVACFWCSRMESISSCCLCMASSCSWDGINP